MNGYLDLSTGSLIGLKSCIEQYICESALTTNCWVSLVWTSIGRECAHMGEVLTYIVVAWTEETKSVGAYEVAIAEEDKML